MRISSLRLHQYRNLAGQEVHFSGQTNLLFGRNAQGKTNLLEAIYLLAYGKSFRTANLRDCIREGEAEFAIEGRVESGSVERNLVIQVSQSGKRLSVQGSPVGLLDFVGNLHVLAFTGDHLKVIRGSPSERRGFLDRAMVHVFPGHLARLITYARTMKQRNRLLASHARSGRLPAVGLLESWDERLLKEGARILRDRCRYVAEMRERISPDLFGEDSVQMSYVSSVEASGEEDLPGIEQSFRDALERNRAAELRRGFTLSGPHRDDLRILVNGKSVSEFGSAGQQRSSLLSLCFAQMEIHRSRHGFYPVFLMDDFEAELDAERMRSFLGFVEPRTQTFIATAKRASVPGHGSEIRVFEVESGLVRTSGL